MHEHDHSNEKTGALVLSVIINVLLTVAEIVGGILSGSLSLIADAVHNLSDAAALAVALIARKIGKKPADSHKTYGYQRAEIVGALINLTALIVIATYLFYEGVMRAINPEPIEGWTVIIVSVIALVVDLATVFLLSTVSKNSLNIKAALLHNLSDAAASVGVIIAGTAALLWQFYILDAVITFVISGYMLWQGVALLKKTAHILMTGVPEDLNLEEIHEALAKAKGVSDVHHLHVWQIDEHKRAAEAHVVCDVQDLNERENVKKSLKALLLERFKIGHSTLEFEIPGSCETGDCIDSGLSQEMAHSH